jgi:probable rRNA maturation factor
MEHSPKDSSLDMRGLPRRLCGLRPLIKKTVEATLRHHGIGTYAVSITFLDDRTMAGLNRKALGKRGATDVIAFDLAENGLVHELVGDIYISLDRARAQSAAFKVSLKEEILRLAIHGLLHTIGYRDHTSSHRRKMELCVERSLREILGPHVREKAAGAR